MSTHENPELHDAELSLLGAALLTHGRDLDTLDFDPADFRHPSMEATWRAVEDLTAAGTPVDFATVWDTLQRSGARVDPAMLHRAVEVAPSGASAPHFARIVSEHAARRRLRAAAAQIAALADEPGDVPAILEDARSRLDAATHLTHTATPVEFVADTMAGTLSRLDEAQTFTPTPWESLNEIIGGWRPGALYTIGARPGVGKSVVGVQAGLDLARHGGVAMLSLEMSQDDVNRRILAQQARIPLERLTRPHALTGRDRDAITQWQARQASEPTTFAVHRAYQVSLTDVRRFARDVSRRRPLTGLVVDYLQLMSQAPTDKRARQEFVADMARGLKLLALEMNVPALMLSQLNRQSTAREDKRPALTDLRESGAIEQDSDVVILLHRDTMDPEKAADMEMIVAKNRHGRPGVADVTFAGHYSEIRSTTL